MGEEVGRVAVEVAKEIVTNPKTTGLGLAVANISNYYVEYLSNFVTMLTSIGSFIVVVLLIINHIMSIKQKNRAKELEQENKNVNNPNK
jgi:biopolymer transport protein ExbB/TolQ